MSDDPLVALAGPLYALAPAAFTAARNEAAKECADKRLAARVKALRKPATAAWALNLLVRREADQIDQVLALGASLREAAEAMQGEELRMLTRQRRQLTTALAGTARTLAREDDVRLTAAVAEQVEAMLTAAMLDPVAADVVRTGLVVTPFTSTGVSDLDSADLLAVPEALGSRAEPTAAPEPARPELHVVVPDDAVRREVARDRVDETRAALAEATTEADAAATEVAELDARRLQTEGELDELRRRVAELEEQGEDVEQQLEEAEENRDQTRQARDAAQAAYDEAVAALAELEE